MAYFQNLNDQTHTNYVVVLTDGMPNCRDWDSEDLTLQAVKDLRAAEVDTFVIGLGEGFLSSNDPALLNAMAEAGGRPRNVPGDHKFYPASDEDELKAAFADIGQTVMSCNISLDPKPEYTKYLWVFFDGEKIERDETMTDGWEYDEDRNQIIFYGESCEKLRSGEVEELEVKMGCAPEA